MFAQLAVFVGLAHVMPWASTKVPVLPKLLPKPVIWMVLGPLIILVAPGYFGAEMRSLVGGQIGAWGLLLFGIVTGADLNVKVLKQMGIKLVILGVASFAIPFVMGFFATGYLVHHYPEMIGPKGSVLTIKLVGGIFTGVTALPVLAAILKVQGLSRTFIGIAAISMATIHDFILWPLAGGINVTNGHGGQSIWVTLVEVGAYLATMFIVVRYVLVLIDRHALQPIQQRCPKLYPFALIGLAFLVMIPSTRVTHNLHLHELLGAVVAGAILPDAYKHAVHRWLEKPVLHVALPCFIVTAGFGVKLDQLTMASIVIFATLVCVNLFSQIFGTATLARFSGFDTRQSIALTALMSSKGVVEYALAKLLADGGIISTQFYSSAILMAIFLTAIAAPIMYLANPRHEMEEETVGQGALVYAPVGVTADD